VFRQVLIESAAILVALILAITVTLALARMLAKSLRRLRRDALAVAERELPETVARLSDPTTLGERTPEQLAEAVGRPSRASGRDEIGQVGQAFTMVHRAAVRVAAEQAVLRTSVSAMFVSLARRSQSLVDRMISQLDEIERDEADPRRLARMFVLDHLATRMRRNDENLLVLAGVDSSPARTTDAWWTRT
jgi:methyl-accepting chemotaxis protein